MTKQKVDWRVAVTAIAGLVVLEIAAMHYGINGKFFATILFIIAGLAGWVMPRPAILK